MDVSKTVIKEILQEVRERLNIREKELEDPEVFDLIEEQVFQHTQSRGWSFRETKKIIDSIFFSLRKDLDILTPLIEREGVSEVMVNGPENIYIEEGGRIKKQDLTFWDREDLEEVLHRIGSKVRREINELNPILDARLEDGSRVNGVYGNIALNGPILTIRKFPKLQLSMEDLIENQTLTRECADFLQKLVQARYNCFISGGTSSGKTTFLNILSQYISSTERVIVIEDAAELQITTIDNLVRMETKRNNSEGQGGVAMDQLIKTSLRMRPDRIIVGEVRGKEVLDMIQAMNTGHDGSLSTGHGNSINGMIRRLESMFLQAAAFPIEAVRSQIAEGIDVFIHLSKLPDGSRRVINISEVDGIVAGEITVNPLFFYHPQKGLIATGNSIQHREKLEVMGWEQDYGL